MNPLVGGEVQGNVSARGLILPAAQAEQTRRRALTDAGGEHSDDRSLVPAVLPLATCVRQLAIDADIIGPASMIGHASGSRASAAVKCQNCPIGSARPIPFI